MRGPARSGPTTSAASSTHGPASAWRGGRISISAMHPPPRPRSGRVRRLPRGRRQQCLERRLDAVDARPDGGVGPPVDRPDAGTDGRPHRRIGRPEQRHGRAAHRGGEVGRPRVVAHHGPREHEERRDLRQRPVPREGVFPHRPLVEERLHRDGVRRTCQCDHGQTGFAEPTRQRREARPHLDRAPGPGLEDERLPCADPPCGQPHSCRRPGCLRHAEWHEGHIDRKGPQRRQGLDEVAAHVTAGARRRRGPRDDGRPVEPSEARPERGIPGPHPAHDGVEGRHQPERARIGRLHEETMERQGFEVKGRVHHARGLEQSARAARRDGERRAIAERPEVRERGTSEEHVAERAGMDDEAAPAHADTRLRARSPSHARSSAGRRSGTPGRGPPRPTTSRTAHRPGRPRGSAR